MTKRLFPIFLLIGTFAYAQIGINNESPNATLEVTGNPTDNTKFDGIIAPRITGDLLKEKVYTPSQTGALIYITEPGISPDGQTQEVTSPGYYYFNGDAAINKWIRLSTGISATPEPWNIQNGNIRATANTQNIYQNGKVGVGFSASDAVSDRQFEVKGDMRAHFGSGTNYFGLDTNLFGIGNGIYYSDNNDLASATSASVVMVRPGLSSLQSNYGSGGGSFATFSDATGGAFGLVANNPNQTMHASVWGYTNGISNSLILNHYKDQGELSSITVEKLKGITFSYKNASYADEGSYTFPRTNGTANQILVTDGGGNASLSWKSLSQVQSTHSFSAPYDTPNSGSLTLNDTHYTVRIYGGNTGIVLPDAGTCKGRIYVLIGSHGITAKPISVVAGGGIYDDATNMNINEITEGKRYQIQSDGLSWIVIGV